MPILVQHLLTAVPIPQYIRLDLWPSKVYKQSGIRIGHTCVARLPWHGHANHAKTSALQHSPAELLSRKTPPPQAPNADLRASYHAVPAPAHEPPAPRRGGACALSPGCLGGATRRARGFVGCYQVAWKWPKTRPQRERQEQRVLASSPRALSTEFACARAAPRCACSTCYRPL